MLTIASLPFAYIRSTIQEFGLTDLLWSLPFGLILLSIAVFPLLAHNWWSRHYPWVVLPLGLLVVARYLFWTGDTERVFAAAHEYFAFIVLIGSLYVVAGGIHISLFGALTPKQNPAVLALGAVLANLIGTTGASMVLIRPFLRGNRIHLTTTDMREAKRRAAAIEHELALNGWGKGKGEAVRFDDLVRDYLEHGRATKAAKTIETDRDSLAAFARVVGNPRLGDINADHFERFRAIRIQTVKPSSVNVALRHLKAAFNWAVERGLLKESPAAKIRLNRVPKNLHPRFLSEVEVERLRAEISDDPELLNVVNFGLWTGMRRNEIVNVCWSDINLDRRTITVQNRVGFQTKSGRSRVIPINPALHTMLVSIRTVCALPGDHVFPINYWSLGKRFLLAVRRAKIDGKVSLHTLRHTFASHVVMKGVDLASIQEILGHRDVTVTMIYSHVSPEHLTRNVDKLPY